MKAQPLDGFEPSLPVSVIIPYFQTPTETEKTLAALEGQSYPRELFEVVVVDDGSEPPFRQVGACPLRLKTARQPRRGFGLARARNLGARVASHDILLFLDSDMLPEAGWIAAHARWHHVLSDALTVGIRKNAATSDVSADAIRERPGSLSDLFPDPPPTACWVEDHLARTADLTSKHDDPFSVVVGANFGMRRTHYGAIGGTDESFRRWGVEDVELGYRAYAHGGLLVPVREATAWHQGLGADHRAAKERSNWINRGKGAHRIAHPRYRHATPGRHFAVPRHVVTLDARRPRPDHVVRTVAKLLADRVHDLVVRVEAGPDDDDRAEYVRNELGPDPRVRVNPRRSILDEFPASAFHVQVPGSAVFARGLVHRLEAHLGDAVQMKALLSDGCALTVTRVWALHRARRAGAEPAAFGDVRNVPASRLRVRAAALDRSDDGAASLEVAPYPSRREAALREVQDVRGVAGAAVFLRRTARRILWRLTSGWRAPRERPARASGPSRP